MFGPAPFLSGPAEHRQLASSSSPRTRTPLGLGPAAAASAHLAACRTGPACRSHTAADATGPARQGPSLTSVRITRMRPPPSIRSQRASRGFPRSIKAFPGAPHLCLTLRGPAAASRALAAAAIAAIVELGAAAVDLRARCVSAEKEAAVRFAAR